MRKVYDLTMTNSEDGDCLMKCLQEVFYWYGYPLNTYKLSGITNCMNLETLEELGKVKCIREEERMNHCVINVDLVRGEKLEECFQTVFETIDSGNLLIAMVNTYHLFYTNDYHKVSGGFFKGYHSVIVNGYDQEKQTIILTDLVFKQKSVEVSFQEFGLAWTYTKDAPFFKPLKYFACSRKENPSDYRTVMVDSLKYSIHMYLSDMKIAEDNTKKANNIFALQRDMQSVVNQVYEGQQKEEIMKNIAYSIFHQVRWSRRSMGFFLDSEEFKEQYDFSWLVSPMCDLYDKWTLVYNLLTASITSSSDKRTKRAYELMNRIIEEEKELIKNIASII